MDNYYARLALEEFIEAERFIEKGMKYIKLADNSKQPFLYNSVRRMIVFPIRRTIDKILILIKE